MHTVENCEHFDGHKCTKCERMLPAYCKDQEILEDKARKFDEMMSAKKEPEAAVETQVEDDAKVNTPTKEVSVAPKVAPVTKGVPAPKRSDATPLKVAPKR